MSKIISFRGTLASQSVDTIHLQTNKGLIGYRLVKLQIIPKNFNVEDEYNISVFKVPFTPLTTFEFTNNRLLAAAYLENTAAAGGFDTTVIFDNEKFNQNIYVGLHSQSGNDCNYYLELEQMDLSLDEQTVATLKDIRNVGAE